MLAALSVAFTILAWASAFPLIRVALRDLAPLPLAAARFAVASLLVTAWLLWKRPARPTLPHMLRFGACGMVGIAFYNALLNGGQQTVTAGAASFIVNTVPIITAVLAALILGERFNRWGWIGTAISFTGIGLIASSQDGSFSFGAGASLVFAAAMCQAVYFILQRSLVPHYGALTCTAYTLLAGALLLTPWLPEALHAVLLDTTSSTATWSVAALGIIPAALGYAAWSYALGYFGAARAANFLYLVPPIATGLAFVLIGELPGIFTLAGGAVAIIGVVLVNFRGRA
ncbi:DMT family transporter [Rhizobium deserti]|uniref:DMT family transporter n=1 Tax=Rhizobium deserti TaxID=2547961 RepID=UPI001FE136EE|nr:DMT family transporter [Rhizobium deserti]